MRHEFTRLWQSRRDLDLYGDSAVQSVMLKRAKHWTAILALAAIGACGTSEEQAADARYTEVVFEVPEGSGPEPVGAEGKEECTTSCSLAKHPIPPYTELDFEMARAKYAAADPEAATEGLETLLFYGPQTEDFFAEFGHGELSAAHQVVLRRELSRTEAMVTLRLVDEDDESVRAVYGPNSVPVGKKQHLATVGEGLLAMEFNGTVMRTGVNYLWSRY